MIREIEYPGASSTRTFSGGPGRGERHRGHIGMIEDARPGPGDSEPTSAVGIGARDQRIGGHPVVQVRLPLLRREKRQQGREGIKREGLARGEREILAMQCERVAHLVVADHGQTLRLLHFNPKVKEAEGGLPGSLRPAALCLHST